MVDTHGGDDADEATGRLGLLGHGTYYLLLTLLSARLLVDGGGGPSGEAGASGAIEAVARQPYGQVLLAGLLLAFGLYALARWVRVVQSDELGAMALNVLRASLWTGLAALTGSALLSGLQGRASASGGDARTSLTQAVFSMPGGRWLIAAVGLGIGAVALYQLRSATDGQLDAELQRLDLDRRGAARALGRAAYAGRGLAYAVIAVFIVHAGVTHDSQSAARGLDGALREAQQNPYGTWLLVAVTVGFATFGLFRLFEARYAEDAEDAA